MQWSGCGVVFAMLGWEVVEKYLHSRGAKQARARLKVDAKTA